MATTNAEYALYGFLIERTAKQYKQVLQRNFQQFNFGITVDQWVILNKIDEMDEVYTNDLAASVMKDPPTVTRILDLLQQKSLVIRKIDSFDRRKTLLILTEQGKQLINRVRPVVMEMRKRGWEGLDNNDLQELQRILDTILHNVKTMERDVSLVQR